MKSFLTAIALSVLILGLGCGGGSSAGGPGGPSGSYSNASLAGNYLLSLGSVAFAPWGGILTFDGRGNVSNGSVDTFAGSFPVSGTYVIAGDGTGTMDLSGTLAGAGVVQQSYHLAISSADVVEVTQTLPAWVKGTLQKQTSATYSLATLNGSYSAYLMDEENAIVARMNMDGAGNITAGEVDGNSYLIGYGTWPNRKTSVAKPTTFRASNNLRIGGSAQATFTGTYTMAGNGRGTITVSMFGYEMRFALYAVDNTSLKIVEIDGQAGLTGEVQRQSANVTVASITGNYILSGMGWATSGPQAQVARLGFDGAGNITAASMDSNAAGVLSTVTSTGTYTVSPTGRGELQLLPDGRSYVFYVGAANRLFVMENDFAGVFGGVAEPQSSSSYGTGTANGTYATTLYINYREYMPELAVGKVAFNGSGGITGTLNFVDIAGNESHNLPASGTYTIDTTGHGTGNITIGSGTTSLNARINFYLVGPDTIRAFVTETDVNSPFVGIATALRQR